MRDNASIKAIGYLELLEQIGSALLRDVAYDLTEHYSPIVRWRALASLNRLRDPQTEQVLKRFAKDPVALVRDAAQRALQQGRVG